MAVKITIIGLGQIGTSVGLALKDKPDLLERYGYDRDLGNARLAENRGALDRVFINLPNAVSEADIVFLSLPMNEVQETLKLIAPDLSEGAVVMDSAPVKGVVADWAAELLPEGCFYVGLIPVINPAYLHTVDSGIDAAHEDLFRNTPMLIAAPPGTASAAVKLAADLTRLLGATPLFAELVELDSLMASTHILPQLIGAALVNATVDQPGWHEGRKLAGRPYAEVTGPASHMSKPEALANSALLSQENVLRTMDGFIGTLQSIRTDIANGDQELLTDRLKRAYEGRERWWKQRLAADWSNEQRPAAEIPTASEVFGRLLGLGRKRSTKEENSQ
jgi:prephenate dehydrogenase